MKFVGIHVTTIRHTEFHKYKKPGPESNWWTLWTAHLFFAKIVYTYLFTKK